MQSKIKVRLAYFVTKTAEVRMTRDMARQLDVRPYSERWNQAKAGEDAPAPMAKVLGKTIGQYPADMWFLLIEHPVSHLAWTVAMDPTPETAKEIVEGGGWVDDLASIPTILM